MEPKSPEQMPTPLEMPSVPDAHEELKLSSPERPNEQSIERAPGRAETSQAATPVVQLPTPVAIPQPASTNDQSATTSDNSNPSAAADEDLIEKEWVDKAKKVISETKDDPHQQERAVGKLQADYLKKRYGKELGNST